MFVFFDWWQLWSRGDWYLSLKSTSNIYGSFIRLPYFYQIHGIISLNCAYVAKEHLNIPSSDQTAVNTDDTALFAVVAVVDIIPTVNVDEASAATQRSKCSYSTHSRSRSTAAAPRDPLRSRSRSKSCARHKLRRKLLFCAPDEASRNAWVADINRLIGRSVETGESEAAGCDVTAGQLEFKLPPGKLITLTLKFHSDYRIALWYRFSHYFNGISHSQFFRYFHLFLSNYLGT